MILAALGAIAITGCGEQPAPSIDSGPVDCNCAASEPPLSGRVVLEEVPGNINPGQIATGGGCSENGAVLLSGGCHIVDQAIRLSGDIHLIEAYKGGSGASEGWVCTWDHRGTQANVAVTATLTCLVPAH
jgi:hypothetical protein